MRGHRQCTTHSLHRRKSLTIPTIIGPRLPDIKDPDLSNAKQSEARTKLLVLFKPFRTKRDLGANENLTRIIFEHWWASDASKNAHVFANNNSDFYEAQKLHKLSVDAEVLRYHQYDRTVDNDEYNNSESDYDENDIVNDGIGCLPKYRMTTRNIYQLQLTEATSILVARSRIDLDQASEIPRMSHNTLRDQIARLERENETRPYDSYQYEPTTILVQPTRVQIEAAIRDAIEWEDPTSFTIEEEPNLPRNSSLKRISHHFGLNRKQHKAFVIVGENPIRSFREETNRQPLRAFLGGKPGSGKSVVIQALQMLAFSWGYPYAVATVAYQGVAAEAAGGQTIHKMFGWGIKPKKRKATPSLKRQERFAQLRLLIVSEISTTGVKFLGMIDAELRSRKNEPNKLLGGLDFLLVGDWLQQLPTAGYPAYITVPPCSNVKKDTDEYLARSRGIAVYRSITTVVMLEENMRHRSDPHWRDILDHWRYGNYLQDDIDYINSVCFDENWNKKDNVCIEAFSPIIVTSNDLRAEFNAAAAIQFCRYHSEILHQFSATISRARTSLTETQQRNLRLIWDDKTTNMPPMLKIAKRMPIQCTKNVSQSMKLSNGSIGYVVDFECSSKDISRAQTLDGILYETHSYPPNVIYIKLRDHFAKQPFPEYPDGIVPVLLRVEKQVEVKMPARSFNIVVTQVPLIPAFSITSDKCQGLTVNRMILGPSRHPTRHNPQRSSFYVAVTRVKTMKQLYLMERLTLDFLQYFKPTDEALAETDRLHQLERNLST